MLFLDRVDAFIYKVCPFVATGVVVGSIYWTAVTYGAVTVMQVCIEDDLTFQSSICLYTYKIQHKASTLILQGIIYSIMQEICCTC